MINSKIRENIEELSGVECASVLLLMLDQNTTSLIMTKFSDSEIKKITQSISTLGLIDRVLADDIINKFIGQINKTSGVIGSIAIAERVINESIPKTKASTFLESLTGINNTDIWQKIDMLNSKFVASFLEQEHPQIIATILSKIKTDKAAEIIEYMEQNLATDVIIRMTKTNFAKQDAVNKIEEILSNKFFHISDNSIFDPYSNIANILSSMDKSLEKAIFKSIKEKDVNIAKSIKTHMISFDDLLKCDDEAIQNILTVIDRNQLVIALKTASESIKNLFIKNMSQSVARIFLEEVNTLGPVRLQSVDEAQSSIMNKVKMMVSRGEIKLNKDI